MRRILVTAALPLFLLAAVGCSDSPTHPRMQGQVRLVDDSGTAWSVVINDPVILAGARQLAGSSALNWFFGRYRDGHGGHNEPWNWHLDPATVDFANVTIEACQTTVRFVHENPDFWRSYGTVCVLSRVLE